MGSKPVHTKFAAAERALPEEIERQARLFGGQDLMSVLPGAVPCALVVLNAQRQIIFANDRFASLAHTTEQNEPIHGQRPGEALDCVHGAECSGGCGTSEFCSTCGAVAAILAAQAGTAAVKECRITRRNGGALELRVWATPVTVAGEAFTIFAVLDISDEKRRRILEHIFLHDIRNVACGIKWCIEFLRNAGPEKLDDCFDDICRLCRELDDEIEAQQVLLKAEAGELFSTSGRVGTLAVLKDAVDLYRGHPVSQDRQLHIDQQAQDLVIVSDRVLLLRVLCNLIKNGLEASAAGQTVTVGCTGQDGQVAFWVHSAGFMPRDAQLQVFQRSFSTKGAGRGLGTYSVKLLTERYLKGEVSFTTDPEEGTTFRVRYPLTLDA